MQIYVSRCCEPSLSEPNYPLNLELAEYINQKKANTPREAAMAVVQHINNRNPHVAVLAIALLRTLVQSVGYPMHLQIATKEFLNELVRRFPERPPPFPGPVMSRILEIIHEWRETICKDSRWKEDLGNIRDMHRLLTFKGEQPTDSHLLLALTYVLYRISFQGPVEINQLSRERQCCEPNSRPSEAVPMTDADAVSRRQQNLKSPEELESEDREAQHAVRSRHRRPSGCIVLNDCSFPRNCKS